MLELGHRIGFVVALCSIFRFITDVPAVLRNTSITLYCVVPSLSGLQSDLPERRGGSTMSEDKIIKVHIQRRRRRRRAATTTMAYGNLAVDFKFLVRSLCRHDETACSPIGNYHRIYCCRLWASFAVHRSLVRLTIILFSKSELSPSV
jgi:hypothetical protein